MACLNFINSDKNPNFMVSLENFNEVTFLQFFLHRASLVSNLRAIRKRMGREILSWKCWFSLYDQLGAGYGSHCWRIHGYDQIICPHFIPFFQPSSSSALRIGRSCSTLLLAACMIRMRFELCTWFRIKRRLRRFSLGQESGLIDTGRCFLDTTDGSKLDKGGLISGRPILRWERY